MPLLPPWVERAIQQRRATGNPLSPEEEAELLDRFQAQRNPNQHLELIQPATPESIAEIAGMFGRSSGVRWLGRPQPSEPLKILYACTQRPGYGGAATEAYEAIKLLRARGHHVTGLFLDEKPLECDPDGIGDIRTPSYQQVADPTIFDGSWHILVGKMWQMGLFAARQGVPAVYITSGCIPEYVRATHNIAVFEAAQRVICHSTLDLELYRKNLPKALFDKIVPEVVRTSALAAARLPSLARKQLAQRRWDICFSASDWSRPEKGGATMVRLCRALHERFRIVVCGRPVFGIQGRPKIDVLDIISHPRMLEIMTDSRVVVIPSEYDSSPNVYIEAAMAGCNIVVSPAVGNIEGHPPELLAAEPTAEAFQPRVVHAAELDRQLAYGYETPDGAAARLEFWLREVASQ